MVTSSRCVTIVGSMAYLIGTRVDGPDAPCRSRNAPAVAESACSTAMLDVIGVFLSNRTALESARSMGRGERDGRGEAGRPGGPSRDLWMAHGWFCNVRRKQREQSRAARVRGSVGKECDPILGESRTRRSDRGLPEDFRDTKWSIGEMITFAIVRICAYRSQWEYALSKDLLSPARYSRKRHRKYQLKA